MPPVLRFKAILNPKKGGQEKFIYLKTWGFGLTTYHVGVTIPAGTDCPDEWNPFGQIENKNPFMASLSYWLNLRLSGGFGSNPLSYEWPTDQDGLTKYDKSGFWL
jgi:hypothetical protein